MKKILAVLLLFCFLISCENKEPNFSKEMIEKISYEDKRKDGIISLKAYNFLDFYVVTDNNEVHKTFIGELKYFYNYYYSKEFTSFQSFLDAVLNRSFVLEKKKLKIVHFNSFKLSPKIEKEYKNQGFNTFLEKHSRTTLRKGELELNKFDLKTDEYLTIAYILFINRYDLSSDCISGRDYVIKREDAFK